MRITLLAIGKTDRSDMAALIEVYVKRLGHYLPFELKVLPDVKRSPKTTPELQKEQEGQALLRQIEPSDQLILFDERGSRYTSVGFADFLQEQMNRGQRHLVFAIGGAYGFSSEVYARANAQITLSSMTFSHQMVRLFAAEQLYRAMTILRGEPYHHQ